VNGGDIVARKVSFGRKKKPGQKKGGSTAFHFGANASRKGGGKKRKGGFGGGS
jgi:hypothetical protein